MAIPALSIGIGAKFPAKLQAGVGLGVSRTGGTVTYRQDWGNVQDIVTPPDAAEVLIRDPGDNQLYRSDLSGLGDFIRPVASQPEAEAGSDNTKTMTPLRVKQSIVANARNGVWAAPLSGAVDQTIDQKFGQDPVFAKDYIGATGSGTDSSAALLQLIENVQSGASKYDARGRAIVLPEGQVRVDQSIEVTGCHGLGLIGQGRGATTLLATGGFPAILGEDLPTDPLSFARFSDFTIKGAGSSNSNGHGIRLGANQGCEIDVRVWACRRGVSLADTFETDLIRFEADGTGGLACYDGIYLEDGSVGVPENAVNIRGGFVNGAVRYGIRAENSAGTNIYGLHVLNCGDIGAYFGDSPSGKDLKWLVWSAGMIDTCSSLLLVKKGSSALGTTVSIDLDWLGYSNGGSNPYGVQLDGLVSPAFSVKKTAAVGYAAIIKNCVLPRISFGATEEYDRLSAGSAAFLVENTTDGQFSPGTMSKTSGSPAGFALVESGTSARNTYLGATADATLYVIPGNGSQLIGCREVIGGVSRNSPPHIPEFTVAQLPVGSTSWQGRLVAVTNETGGYTLAFCDGTNWRRIQDRNVVS